MKKTLNKLKQDASKSYREYSKTIKTHTSQIAVMFSANKIYTNITLRKLNKQNGRRNSNNVPHARANEGLLCTVSNGNSEYPTAIWLALLPFIKNTEHQHQQSYTNFYSTHPSTRSTKESFLSVEFKAKINKKWN